MKRDSVVTCKQCGHTIRVSFARCLRAGWPKCHGQTMRLVSSPSPEKIDRAVAGCVSASVEPEA